MFQDLGEKIHVLWVRARPAALYIMDAELIQQLGDINLVIDRERDILGLGAIAQGGIEEFYLHGNNNRKTAQRENESYNMDLYLREIFIWTGNKPWQKRL